MKIEVKPIERQKWHGKKEKEDFTRPKTIRALVDGSTREYTVSITKERLKEISEQINQDLSVVYNPTAPHPFWDDKIGQVTLENNTMYFDTKNVYDEIKVGIMKGSRFVANSLAEYQSGLYPDATHVIYNEEEEVEVKAKKAEVRKNATLKAANLSKTKKIEIILIMTGKDVRGKSDSHIEVEIDSLIEKNPVGLLKNISANKDVITAKALVVNAIDKSILKREGPAIKYFDSIIGYSEDEVVDYLLEPANNEIYIRIQDQLEV